MISNLRKARLFQGKSQYHLEKETSIPQTLISLYERGLRRPSQNQKEQLALALGVSEKELFSNGDAIE